MSALSRRERIVILLEHLPDYDAQPGRNELGDSGRRSDPLPPQMSKLYNDRCVQELYRCLDTLRKAPDVAGAVGSTVHAHLVSYYTSEFKIVRPRPLKRVLRGEVTWIEPKPGTWRRERIDRLVSEGGWIVDAHLERGTAFIDEHFRGEPYLPEDLLWAVA